MQQYTQGFLPSAFDSIWTTNAVSRSRMYILRNDNDLYIPPARLALTDKQPYHNFPKIWANFTEYTIKIQREKLYLTLC